MVELVFPVNGLCLEMKQMSLKSCVARNCDPCLKLRSLSQPQIFFQQFCFHEIRLTEICNRGPIPANNKGTDVAHGVTTSFYVSFNVNVDYDWSLSIMSIFIHVTFTHI